METLETDRTAISIPQDYVQWHGLNETGPKALFRGFLIASITVIVCYLLFKLLQVP